MIRVAGIEHTVKHAKPGADGCLMIGERIPSQTDAWIKVSKRGIHRRGLSDGHPVAERRIQKIKLLVSNRFDDARW